MTFYLQDANDYTGYLYLTTSDYETEASVDVDACYNYETEEWNQEAVRETAEQAVKAQFGEDATIIWKMI